MLRKCDKSISDKLSSCTFYISCVLPFFLQFSHVLTHRLLSFGCPIAQERICVVFSLYSLRWIWPYLVFLCDAIKYTISLIRRIVDITCFILFVFLLMSHIVCYSILFYSKDSDVLFCSIPFFIQFCSVQHTAVNGTDLIHKSHMRMFHIPQCNIKNRFWVVHCGIWDRCIETDNDTC